MDAPLTVESLRQLSPERVCVRLSSGEELKAGLSDVAALRLYRGQALDEDALEALRGACALTAARTRALELLSRRPLSARELEKKLLEKGHDAQSAAACIRWLQENRLLDDESYAEAVARHYAAKGYGPGRIRTELSRRGVPRDFWDEAVARRPDNSKKLDAFIAARLRDSEDRDQVRKLTAALLRRGFGWDEIREALARFRAEAPDEED